MMKKDAVKVVFAAAVTLLVAALAPTGRAAAQPQPTLTITPSSGPCGATVDVRGSGFEPGSEVPLDLAGPHSDVTIGRLAVAVAGQDGEFRVEATFGPLGCQAAARDTEVGDPGGPRDLGIFAGHDPARRFVLARAVYHYTTTTTTPSAVRVPPGGAAAQPQPTLTLSPGSGPCDATVEVIGSGYPASAAISISLLRPHSEGDFAVLASASATPSGDFQVAADLALGSVGCDVAALDDELDDSGEPKELFILAYVPPTPFVGRSAYATYTYTTPAPQPQPTLTITPPSGPCDAIVDVSGEGFEPAEDVPLDLARPNSDDVMGRLAVATADSDGKFSARVSLGDLGCHAAALDDRFGSPGSPKEIEIYAGSQPDVLFVAARARYTYTTTALSPAPQVLPSTGSGPQPSSTLLGWLALAGAVGALGVMLVAASLCARRSSN